MLSKNTALERHFVPSVVSEDDRAYIPTAEAEGLTPLFAKRALGSVQVAISGKGTGFCNVTAHFRLPDGTSVPFYAWNVKGSSTNFVMPLTTEGLRLSVDGDKSQELTLGAGKATGTHVLTQDGGTSELRITVTAA